jgi:hypothetical protein
LHTELYEKLMQARYMGRISSVDRSSDSQGAERGFRSNQLAVSEANPEELEIGVMSE